jgi:hypothetical protein
MQQPIFSWNEARQWWWRNFWNLLLKIEGVNKSLEVERDIDDQKILGIYF